MICVADIVHINQQAYFPQIIILWEFHSLPQDWRCGKDSEGDGTEGAVRDPVQMATEAQVQLAIQEKSFSVANKEEPLRIDKECGLGKRGRHVSNLEGAKVIIRSIVKATLIYLRQIKKKCSTILQP